MAAGKINLQANDGAVVGLVVPDGLGSGERQIALGVNLSGVTAYHLLQGNLSISNEVLTNGFSTTLYTGNGATQSINTGIDMDTQWGNDASEKFGGLVWLKSRSVAATNNYLFDSIRGAINSITSNGAGSNTDYITSGRTCSLNASGFSIGNETSINANLATYVSWNFQTTHIKTGTTNHGKAYTCHYNPFTGFTIVNYEGSGIAGHEIQHSLGRKLGFRSIKNLSAVNDWATEYDDNGYLKLNTTDAYNTLYKNTSSDTAYIINSAVANWNQSTHKYIMYGWANSYLDEADKLIGNYEIGVYKGTGVAGNKVTTRGKPAWIMIKRLDSISQWRIFDNQRGDKNLNANTSEAETSVDLLDIINDGFILKDGGGDSNASDGQYLYMVVYDNDSGSGKSKYPRATDTSNVQINNAIIPLAHGVDSNGSKNSTISKNETITGLTHTAGKNYLYKTDTGYGVKPYEPRYLSSELVRRFAGEQPDYYDVESNKWFNTDAGSELVSNGTFDVNTSGWTSNAPSTISISNATLLISRVSNASAYYAQTLITTVIGKKYKARCYYSSAGQFILNASSVSYGDNLGSFVSISGSSGVAETEFVAQTTTTYIVVGSSGLTTTAILDNISVFPADITPTTEITESRNYLNHIVHADQNGQPTFVEELLKIEYKDIVKANEFRGKNACTAWVNFDGTTTPPTIRDSYNVSAVIRTSFAGDFTIFFEKEMDNTTYGVSCSGDGQGVTNDTHINVGSPGRKFLNRTTLYSATAGGVGSNYNTYMLEIKGGKN